MGNHCNSMDIPLILNTTFSLLLRDTAQLYNVFFYVTGGAFQSLKKPQPDNVLVMSPGLLQLGLDIFNYIDYNKKKKMRAFIRQRWAEER